MQQKSNAALETSGLTRLPSLPGVLIELLSACDADDVSFQHLADLVDKDPALAAKVMAAGHSAAYGGNRGLRSLEQVLALLGTTTVKTIVIAASVQQFFAQITGGARIDLQRFWREALTAAGAARLLAELTSYRNPDEAYLGGLLANIGQLVLATGDPDGYAAIESEAQGAALIAAERARFGIDHAELGARLIDGWRLQSHLADAVRFHHELPAQMVDAPHLVRIIHVASAAGTALAAGPEPAREAARELFGLTPELLSGLLARVREQTAGLAEALGIDTDTPAASPGAGGPLADAARESALLYSVQQRLQDADDLDALCEAVFHCTNILFGLQPILLLRDPEREHLHGIRIAGQDWRVGELTISCDNPASLLVRAMREGRILASADGTDGPASVVERQIAQLAGGRGLLCLPLAAAGEPVGVLACGIDDGAYLQTQGTRKLLRLFAREAATAIAAQRERQRRLDQTLSQTEARWHDRAREIVHEANNPLAIIRNYLRVLGNKLEERSGAQEELQIIREEIDRVAALLRGLTEIDAEQPQAQPVDLNDLIEGVVALTSRALADPQRTRITTAMDASLPPIVTRADLLKQVLINLVKNAAEALADGGEIRIETNDYVYWQDREYVEISVADDGPGIPPHVLAKLFSPVQSTKGGGHAGLGLSMTRNLVQEMDGHIACRSSESRGTRFQILLPRTLVL